MVSTSPSRKKIFDIVGESHTARDGTPRQELLTRCNPGDPVLLERHSDNAHDVNAILVVWQGLDLGFIAGEDAAALAPWLDRGEAYSAIIERLTGGTADYPSYGAKVAIASGGTELPPPKPLTENQIRSRRGRVAAAGRERDASGAFVKKKEAGCMGMLLLMGAVPLASAAATWFG